MVYPENHFILFTGHMIDKPGRSKPRFPASKEGIARKAIQARLKQLSDEPGKFFGIAGGACGGDILFHEIASELNIPTAVYLALSKEKFIKESVAFAGEGWVRRFNGLCNLLPVQILPSAEAFPNDNAELDIWERSNRWMLHKALQNGARQMTLLTLWNGSEGDGTGGTAHMVAKAKELGSKVVIIDTRSLFEI